MMECKRKRALTIDNWKGLALGFTVGNLLTARAVPRHLPLYVRLLPMFAMTCAGIYYDDSCVRQACHHDIVCRTTTST